MSEEKKAQEQKDPTKEMTDKDAENTKTAKVDPLKELKATPQGMTTEEAIAYLQERARRDPRYRKGGSRYKERGE